MDLKQLLAAADSFGIKFELRDQSLLCHVPKGLQGADAFLQEIKAQKQNLTDFFSSKNSTTPAIAALSRDGAPPLSFAQQRLWFLQQLEPGNTFYHIPVAARLDGPLDVEHFAAALNAVVARHEALRTSFPVIDGMPVQHIADSLALPLPLTDLARLDPANADRQAEMLAAEHAAIPFDLASGPLLNAHLLRLAPQRHVLLLSMHHIIADGWSMSVLAREIALLYGALTEGRPSPLPPLAIQYADFALWQRRHLQGETLQRQLVYWSAQLAGSPPLLALPTRGPRPAVQRHAGNTHAFRLDADLGTALTRLGRQHGATLFMTLLAALQLLLARYSGQRDIVVGSPVANRHHAELEPLIGFFVNTLALRGHIDPNDSFAALLAQVRATTLDAYAHQDLPFEQVVDALGLPRRLDHAPLFQVMFVLQNTPEVSLRAGELHLSAAQAAAANSAKFDLTLSMSEQDGALGGLWEFNTDLFESSAIDALSRHFAHLLEQACADPLRPLRQYTLCDASDTGRLRASRSPSHATELSVIALFERQADATPNAPAVQCGQRTLSYAALDAHANALAQRLLAHGASPDQLIGVCLERSLHTVIAMLAIMKAGAACLPLDPAYPPERLAYMLADAGVRLLLTEPALSPRLPDSAQRLLLSPEPAPMAEPAIRPMKPINPQQLAYCIYTSGSTGRPKGVAVPHHGLGNMILAQIAEFGVRADDRVLQFASTSFDASVSEIFMALLAGATLVLRPPHTLLGDELAAELTAQRITVATLPPALLRQMAPDACPTLRVLIAAGEACKPQDLAPWRERQCYNAYGPSEFTVCASIHAYIGETQAASVPIGLPIANTEAYVLDAAWQPMPAGVAGELCLGGAGLARGYLQRPGLTAERFVPHPYAHGQRLYRTGDLARVRPDGQLEFLGRLDHQVKIRGFRIETGEVEAQLLRYPGLRQAAVLARDDRNGHPQLLAYVAGETLTPQALREHLRQALPEYMLPAHLLILPSLPQTPNGKLDRAALPSPDELPVQTGTPYAAPQTPVELLLAQLWADVLGIERVGLHDNFFELGGDSILAIQLVARARQQMLGLTVKQLFEHQSIAALAPAVGPMATPAAEQGEVTGSAPLLPIQHWFFEQDLARPHHWNQSVLLETKRHCEPALLCAALDALLSHHDALRLRIGQPGWQTFGAQSQADTFSHHDLTSHAAATQQIEACCQDLQTRLDFTRGPLLRCALFDLGAESGQRLFIAIHHLAVDAVSWRILLQDLEQAYDALSRKQAVALAPKTSSYKQWTERLASHAHSPALQAERAYWQQLLASGCAPLPQDPLDAEQADAPGMVSIRLSAEHTSALLQQAPRAYRTQVNDLLLAALAMTLSAWTGGSEVLIDLEGHGREELFDDIDLSRTVGWFTTQFPVRLQLPAQAGAAAVIKAVKEQLRQIPNKGIGYGMLRYMSPQGAGLRDLPARAQVGFNYLGQVERGLGDSLPFKLAAEASGAAVDAANRGAHALDINGEIVDGCLHLRWSYDTRQHRRATVERQAGRYLDHLAALIAHCLTGEGGYTPSDFPLAQLEQQALDQLHRRHPGLEDVYPLSPLQQGMLFHTLYAPRSGVYIEQTSCGWDGALDAALFHQAWRQVVQRHPILRTGIDWQHSEAPMQIVHPEAELPFSLIDWQHLTPDEQATAVEALLRRDVEQGFALDQAPLLRLTVICLAPQRYRVALCFHHILLDGWSGGTMFGEVFACYAALLDGRTPQLAPVLPYRAYIGWLQRQDAARTEEFWRAYLQGYGEPAYLSPVPPQSTAAMPAPATHRLALTPTATATLAAFARRYQLTLNTVVQGAWALLLARHTRRDDVVFGITVAGRPPELITHQATLGLFINTLPLRLAIREQQAVASWLLALQENNLALRQHEHAALTDIQRYSDLPAGQMLFDTLMVFENYPRDQALLQTSAGLATQFALRDIQVYEQSNYPLSLSVAPGEQLEITFGYLTSHFDSEAVAQLAAQLSCVLSAMAEGPESRLASIALTSRAEQTRLRSLGDPAAIPLPAGQDDIVQLFEAQARRTPHTIAVSHEGQALSYAELDGRANQLARLLRARGASTEQLIGLCVERSPQMLIGMLGILKAGAAYLPLDPGYPQQRLAYMLTHSGASLLVTEAALHDRLPQVEQVQCLVLEEHAGALAQLSAATLGIDISPQNLAYCIYTSGSTGKPKGVQVLHRSACNLLAAMQTRLGLTAADRLAAVTSLSFDIAVLELLLPLIVGARVVIATQDVASDGERLAQLLQTQAATVMQATPATWELLAAVEWMPTRAMTLLCGGEAWPAPLAGWLLARGTQVWNVYGPTETTVWSTAYRVLPEAPVYLGAMIDNTELYLLDDAYNLVPHGLAGELYIGGTGLARGYLHRPDLTAERFVPHPFKAGARLYRTGDLVRSQADGSLEYLGRIDQQVKLRGFRIELGEIEAQLLRHPQVRQALVTARRDAGREPRLVAYLVAAGDAMPETAALQALLQQDLPDYMLPAHYVWMERLPLTPNGKIDRAALPAPDEAAPAAGQTAPRTPAEQLLAQIWTEVLGIADVGVHDNFFDLGGHSLLATRIISRLRKQFQLDLPLRTLFESPTIELLVRRIAEASASAGALLPPLTALPRDGAPPLSFAQQRLWFLQQLEPGNAFYHIPIAARLDGPLDVAHFAAALNAVVSRHEALRTSFPVIDDMPVQHIADSLTLPLPLTDLAHMADADRQAEMLATEHAAIPFDLASGPLLNARLLRLAPQRHVLLLSMHHIIADGWSMSVLAREIALLYGALTEGRPSPLPPLAIQYADFALWQRRHLQGETLQRQLAYWSAQLAGSPPLLALPTRAPRPAVQRHAGSTHAFRLDADLGTALARLGRQHGATLFMTLLAALQLLLARYSGQRDIVVGSPVANRHHAELEPLIGFFVNTLALRGHIDPNDSFAALLAQVRATTLDAYAHQDLPFEQVVDALGLPRRLDHAPLFQVMFVLQNTPEVSLRAGELHLSAAQAAAANSAKFDLTLSMSEQDGALGGLWEFNTDLFDPATIDALGRHFAHLLEQACADPLRPLRQYTLCDAADNARMLASRSPSHPTELSVITLFERQADATPNAPAVQCGQRTLSYAALDAHANALAQRLLAHGASPDQLIGVCLERSLHTVIAMLAIMKAGAACLPLDPAYPPERLAYMLADAGVRLLLTEPALRARLPDSAQHLLLSPEPAPMAEPAIRPMKAINPQQLAYCIYTSGSTGRPKGVAVPHHGLGNMILAQIAEFGVRADDRVLQFASTSFDASVSEIFMALLAGATLVLRPPHTLLGDELAAELTAQRITVATLPPALLRQMAPDACPTLRVLIAAGEACKPQDLAPWRERQCYNAYGPSEFTVCASIHAYIGETQAASVPIGLPIANTEAYVLDAAWQPVPAGVAGELCLGGAGLARGYLQRPGLTTERFVPHPYAHGQRLYRTGDLARFCPDGQLEFLGRLDHQVKIRGFRIETGEVEAQLLRYPGLRQAAVLARDDRNGHPQLLAYVAGDALTPQALREHLRQALPEYMLPAHLLILPELPQTPNGKLDRGALPSPDELAVQSGTPYTAPQTPAELLLAQLWTEVLGVERVGLHDNFFELGGHSLLATQVLSKLRHYFQLELPVRALFEEPTVAGLAGRIAQAGLSGATGRAPLPAIAGTRLGYAGKRLPLSFAQQRLWFLDQLHPQLPAYYIMPHALRLRGDLDAAAFATALNAVVARHENLRTTFPAEGGVPYQSITPQLTLRVPEIDLSALDGDERALRMETLRQQDAARPFNLAAGPLIRATIVRVEALESVVLLTMHHIVSDGWSMGVLLRELAAHYTAAVEHRSDPLPPLPLQYADFALWQRQHYAGAALERQLAYWKRQLADAPALLALPLDRPRVTVQPYVKQFLHYRLPADLCAQIHAMNRREGLTPFMSLLAALNLLFHSYSGQDDINIGGLVANRHLAELEPLIGFFVNTLVFRTRLLPGLTLADLLAQVRTCTLDAYAHQDLPFDQLLKELNPPRGLSHSPLFQVLLVLQNATASLPNGVLPGLEAIPDDIAAIPPAPAIGKACEYGTFDITLNVTEEQGGFYLRWEYNCQLLEPSTVAAMHERLAGLLQLMASARHTLLQDIAPAPLPRPAVAPNVPAEITRTAANSPTERQLLDICGALLEVEQPGAHDNFFALGGHSLLAVRLLAQVLQTFGIDLPLRSIFEASTIAELAARIDLLVPQFFGECK